MDFLKWLMKASFILALMFLGLNSERDSDERESDRAKKTSSIQQIFTLH